MMARTLYDVSIVLARIATDDRMCLVREERDDPKRQSFSDDAAIGCWQSLHQVRLTQVVRKLAVA